MIQDQYDYYQNFPLLLKRYSLASKMHYCFSSSIEAYHYQLKKDYIALSNIAHPWELETFAMLSIIAQEYQGKKLNGKKFAQMISAIRDAQTKALEQFQGDELVQHFLPLIGMQQFPDQEQILPYLYRFWCLFEDDSEPVRLKSHFEEMFHCSYIEFALFAKLILSLLLALYQIKSDPIEEFYFRLKQILEKNKIVFNALTITREDYIKLAYEYSNNDVKNMVSCLCPSVTYPILKGKDNIYIPLPHLIMRSCTTSLMYRLTRNKKELNEIIGKYCLEKYLKRIIKEAGCYDDVIGEIEYKKGHNTIKSSDVIAKEGNQVLFFENKFLRPRLDLRYLNENAYFHTINRVATQVNQLYIAMKDYSINVLETQTMNDLWGIAVIYDDPFLEREQCMLAAARIIGIDNESFEYEWLIHHIRIMSLYDVEVFCLAGQNIIDGIIQSNKAGNNPFDITPPYILGAKYTSKSALEFQTHLDEMIKIKANALLM